MFSGFPGAVLHKYFTFSTTVFLSGFRLVEELKFNIDLSEQ